MNSRSGMFAKRCGLMQYEKSVIWNLEGWLRMCGCYGLNQPDPVLADWYRASFIPELKPRYNIVPTMEILTVCDTGGGRMGSRMRWAFIPYRIRI